MKKIFYFIASAIVALGAVACQNDINENIAPESEGLSFTAEVEMTRIDIGTFEEGKGYPVVWENGDKLNVTYTDENEVPHTFTFTFDGEKFVCEETGVNNLVGETVSVNYFASSHGIDSTKGKAGMFLASSKVTFENGMTIDLSVQNSFLRFSSTDDVTLTLSEGAFFVVDDAEVQSITLTGDDDVWVAFKYGTGAPYTLSASIDGVTVKQTTTFTPQYGKIYNLGDIELKKSEWAIIGSFAQSNWVDIEMYETGAFAVATNITLATNNAVKFRKYSWDNDKQRTCCTAFNLNDITFVKNDGSDSPACNLAGTYDIYIPKTNAGYVIVVEAGEPLPETVPTKISLIGGAVGGWDAANDVMLTWDKNTALFKVTNKTVTASEIKIRANQGWDHSWGSGGAWTVDGQNEIWYNGGNSSIVAGTYDFYTNLKAVSVVTAGSATPSL